MASNDLSRLGGGEGGGGGISCLKQWITALQQSAEARQPWITGVPIARNHKAARLGSIAHFVRAMGPC